MGAISKMIARIILIVIGAISTAGGSCEPKKIASGSLLQTRMISSELPFPFHNTSGAHCCSMLDSRINNENLLICDSTHDDYILQVPFAWYGDSAEVLKSDTCGREMQGWTTKQCGEDVKAQVAQRCKGKQSCTLDAFDFGNPCPGVAKRLLVRWTCSSDSVTHAPSGLSHLPQLPLRAQGALIVDNVGNRFRIKGVNWAGGQLVRQVPSGLENAPVATITRLISRMGFNLVRVPFAVQTILQNPIVDTKYVAANPQLYGKHALEVLDVVIEALAREGLVVVLDNHMNEPEWCCDEHDCNGFWFSKHTSTDQWIEAIRIIARRYADTPNMIGIGLKNEPRHVCDKSCDLSIFNTSQGTYPFPMDYLLMYGGVSAESSSSSFPGTTHCMAMGWNSGPSHLRYQEAMTRAGRTALQEDPNLLISVSGLRYASDLSDARHAPIDIPRQNLVYEVHDYSFWYDKVPSSLTGIYPGDFATYKKRLEKNWGYLLRESIAPVWISEFGSSNIYTETNPITIRWWDYLSRYIQNDGPLANRGGLDWAFWQLSGVIMEAKGRDRGSIEGYGILNECNTDARKWHTEGSNVDAVQSLMARPELPFNLQSIEDSKCVHQSRAAKQNGVSAVLLDRCSDNSMMDKVSIRKDEETFYLRGYESRLCIHVENNKLVYRPSCVGEGHAFREINGIGAFFYLQHVQSHQFLQTDGTSNLVLGAETHRMRFRKIPAASSTSSSSSSFNG